MLKTGCTTQESDLICLSQLWRYLSYLQGGWNDIGTRRNRAGREVVMSNGINLTINRLTHHATVLTVVESAAAKQMFC
jgi:hypothetical protein